MTARTGVSHAAAFFPGLHVAGGWGRHALRHEQGVAIRALAAGARQRREAEASLARARSNLGRAMKAEALLQE
jgi:hypothetical protein